jgi:hypothetical protein
MMSDLICGLCWGYGPQHLQAWLGSIKASGYSGEVLVMLGVDDKETGDYLRAKGVHTVAFDPSVLRGRSRLRHEIADHTLSGTEMRPSRWYVRWTLIKERLIDRRFLLLAQAIEKFCRDYGWNPRFLLCTDVRDVVFQRNPSDWMEQNLQSGEDYLLAEEPTHFGQSWHRRNFVRSYGVELFWRVADRTPINAGVVAGRYRAVLELMLADYLVNSTKAGADQAALNLMMTFEAWRTRAKICSWNDDWALHAAVIEGAGH